jgi:hypothetical protein
MPHFANAALAAFAGEQLNYAHLVEFFFASGTERVWTGYGDLDLPALNGSAQTWKGLGKLGGISDLDLSAGLGSEPLVLTLSGIETSSVDQVRDQESEVKRRRCVLYLQVFTQQWAPIDTPRALFAGQMDSMKIRITATEAIISLSVDHVLTPKHRAPFGNYSLRDQAERNPGDKSFTRGVRNAGRELSWP